MLPNTPANPSPRTPCPPMHPFLFFITWALQYNSLPRLEGVIFLLFFRAFHGYHLLLNALSAISYRLWPSPLHCAVQSRWGPYGHRAQTPKFILPKKEFDTTPWTIITKQNWEINVYFNVFNVYALHEPFYLIFYVFYA